MSEDFDDWNPMNDDFQSIAFNSYSSGQTAANLPFSSLPAFGSQNKRPPKLYIDGFPSDLTESGLRNFLQRIGCQVLSVKIVSSRSRFGRHFSFVDFETTKEAQKAIELINNQKIYKLSVSFATTETDRQLRHKAIEKEKQDFHRLVSNQIEMKEKIDLGGHRAINSNSNGDSSSISPIHSESESHDSSHLDVLSPLAKSDKLLKVLERPEDNCSFCSEPNTLEHLHFILSDQQIIDPTKMPELIGITHTCLTCNRKGVDLKSCSQCKNAIYCGQDCQSIHWPKHRAECRSGPNRRSKVFLEMDSTLESNKTNGNISQIVRNAESVKSDVSTPQSGASLSGKPKMTKTTPQIVNKIRAEPKESTPLISDSQQKPDSREMRADDRPQKPIETLAINQTKETIDKNQNIREKVVKTNIETEVLKDGEEGVTLCFGRNPFDFYLQKSSAFESMDLFADELFKKMNDFPQLTDEELKIGTLCGGIYKADGSCYRARIVSEVNDDTFALYFIDYGNTEPVEKRDIKRLPQIFFDCRAQAIHCSLEIVPKNNVWSKEAITLFGDIGETNEFSKVKIFEKTNEGIYKIDLINKKGDSIRQLFVQKGFATIGGESSHSTPIKTPSPKPPAKSDSPVVVQGSPKVTFNRSSITEIPNTFNQRMAALEEKSEPNLKSYFETFESNQKLGFMIASFFNADKLQYLATVFVPQIQNLIITLNENYSINSQTVVPKVDEFVVAKGSDDEFYRSYILKVGPKSCKVFMIDAGYIEDVDNKFIYKLEAEYQEFPVYGVVLLPENSSGAVDIEQKHATDTTIEGIFIRNGDKLFSVSEDYSIRFLDFKSAIDFVKQHFESVIQTSVQPIVELPLRTLPLNQSVDLLALYQDPNDYKIFYVAGDIEMCEKLMTLCVELSTRYSDENRVKPIAGKVYLIRSSDNDWYRGVVTDVNGDKINVKYIDFGNEEEVDSKYVMEVSEQLSVTNINPLAIKCKVEKTKLSETDLRTKIENGVNGTYLLKVEALKLEEGIHFVKVK